ncbi:hypothetical protein [Fictibacillus sp. JL2B1089]|uniref:hypothetical protein n=1 Tax=Fictibacillus sp. JL2B1089 TaxID=3399565 RepID=UPI003A86159B
MVVIILSLCIPLAFIAGGFVAYKGVQLGLRWQSEVKQERVPTMKTISIPNPIAQIKEAKQERELAKQMEETKSIFNEWVNGAEESR